MKTYSFITFIFLLEMCCINSIAQNRQTTNFNPEPIIIDAQLGDWKNFKCTVGLNNPWSLNNKDSTFFAYRVSNEYFNFYFKTIDSTLTTSPFDKELSVAEGDRVEVFFSTDTTLNNYYCLELSPYGNILDYHAKYYREFDDKWNFKSLEISTNINDTGFIVEGKINMNELKSLGLEGEIYLGIFRADYLNNKSIEWYTKTIPPSKKLDFHFPEVFERIVLN